MSGPEVQGRTRPTNIFFGPTNRRAKLAPPMKRPIGLILSAIVLSLAALFLLFITALMAFSGRFAAASTRVLRFTALHLYLMLAIGAFYAVLTVWAILTVIGILRLRPWGRYSILIIGGGLAALNLFIAVFTILVEPRSHDSHPNNRRSTPTSHFSSPIHGGDQSPIRRRWNLVADLLQPPLHPRALLEPRPSPSTFGLQGQIQPHSHRHQDHRRLPTLLRTLRSASRLPALPCFSSRLYPSANCVSHHVSLLCRLTALTGYGLSRLREPARLLTIALLILGCCNIFLASLPWYQAQFCLYITQLMPAIPTIPGQPGSSSNTAVR